MAINYEGQTLSEIQLITERIAQSLGVDPASLSVGQSTDGGYLVTFIDVTGKPSSDPLRVVGDMSSGFRIDQSFKGIGNTGGSGAQAPQGQYIKGAGGKLYYAAPYGGGLQEAGDVGVDPQWTSINDQRTGQGRLFDPNSGRSIDLGQTGFAGLDPREGENVRRLEADRLFAYQQAQDAEAAARQDRQFEASTDLQNRQLGLSAARDLSSLSDAKEERNRQILKGASDFVYRSFISRGKAAPEPYVSHADLINSAAAEFDKIASIYQQALTPKPMSSGGRLVPPSYQPLPALGSAPSGAPPTGGAGTSQPAPAPQGGIPNWGPTANGGYGITGYNQPAVTPVAAAAGPGGGGRLAPPPALAPNLDDNDYSYPAHASPYVAPPSLPYTTAPTDQFYPSGSQATDRDRLDYERLLRWQRGGLLKPTGGTSGMGEFKDGGRAPADEPYIVGEDGYEIALPQPDGTTHIIPNEIARKLVSKDGDMKKQGRLRLKGFEDGTWGGYANAGAAIGAFNAAAAASAPATFSSSSGWSYGGSPAPSAPSAPSGGGGGYAATPGGPSTVGLPGYGGGQGTPTWVPGGWTYSPQTGLAGGPGGMAYPQEAFANGPTPWAGQGGGGSSMVMPMGTPGAGAPAWLGDLINTLRPQQTSQAQLLADEARLRPPAVDSILGGTEIPGLNIVGPNGVGNPKLASRLALNKLTPDELEALNASLGVRYNSTLDDYLAASDQRYLAGAGQRRLRTSYR